MGESVLCGCIRWRRTSSRERLRAHLRSLSDTVPFVYASVPPGHQVPDEFPLPVVRDCVDQADERWTGVHSVLKRLRQPILMTHADQNPPVPSIGTRLVETWNQCQDRLSGVFLRNKGGIRRYPGLYATPLLPELRSVRQKNEVPARVLLQSEPKRFLGSPEPKP